MAVEIRPAKFPEDEPGIASIDTSFTTEVIFEIEVGPRGFRLVETPIPPRTKRFVIYDLGLGRVKTRCRRH